MVATIRGRWLAPRAPRRPTFLPGLVLKIALFGLTAVLLGRAGPLPLAIASSS